MAIKDLIFLKQRKSAVASTFKIFDEIWYNSGVVVPNIAYDSTNKVLLQSTSDYGSGVLDLARNTLTGTTLSVNLALPSFSPALTADPSYALVNGAVAVAGGAGFLLIGDQGTNRLFRSTDGGVNFSLVAGAPANKALTTIGNDVYAANDTGLGTISKSSDGGLTWTTITTSGFTGSASDDVRLRSVGNILIGETASGSFLSSDFGSTWVLATTMPEAYVDGKYFSWRHLNYVTQPGGPTTSDALKVSIDGISGWSFTPAIGFISTAFFAHNDVLYAFSVAPLAGATTVYKSTNGGTTWSVHETNPLPLARDDIFQATIEMHNFPGLSVSVSEYGPGVYLT